MVELDFIIICDNASIDEGKKLNLIGIFDTINALNFPAVHPFMSVAAGIEIESGNHTEIMIIEKNNSKVIETNLVNFYKPTDGKHRFIHNLSNIQFPWEGEYNVNIFVDNKLIGSTKLFLKKN